MKRFYKAFPGLVIAGIITGCLLVFIYQWAKQKPKEGQPKPQTIEQKVLILQDQMVYCFNEIEILKKEPETLKIPVMSDENDGKARKYGNQFQEEIEP